MSHFVELVFTIIRDSEYPLFSIVTISRCIIYFDVIWVEQPEGHGRLENIVWRAMADSNTEEMIHRSPPRQFFRLLCDDWSLFTN